MDETPPDRADDADAARAEPSFIEDPTPAQSGSTTSSTPKTKGRNLVVCIDGTGQKVSVKNTHVLELYSRLISDDTQLKFYVSGIGAHVEGSSLFVRMKQKLVHGLDMAVALNHDRITLSAYEWLSENYVDGDRIYLFGFSRGAYQVRIISGIIKTVGLVRKGNKGEIPFAYQWYLALMDVKEERGNNPRSARTKIVCAHFKKALCYPRVVVHFLGAWDTVSSIGITRGEYFPETATGMLHVRTFRHALSLHEPRAKFLPEFGNGALGPIMTHDHNVKGDVKEVWFAGSHSDVGGGNDGENTSDLNTFGPSLRWMLYEAMDRGLRVRQFQGGWREPIVHPSMTWAWRILEAWPIKRLSYNSRDRTAVQRWPPPLSYGRRFQTGQRLHESAVTFLTQNPSYATKTRIQHEGYWDPIDHHISANLVERYPHSSDIDNIISMLKDAVNTSKPVSSNFIDVKLRLWLNDAGKQNLIDSLYSPELVGDLFRALQLTTEARVPEADVATTEGVAVALSQILDAFYLRPRGCDPRLVPELSTWLRFADANVRDNVIRIFGPHVLMGHTGFVNAVSWIRSQDPAASLIASGSADGTIRLWNAETGHPNHSSDSLMRSQADSVLSVAFSFDGKWVASDSDTEIQIWNVESQKPENIHLAGHGDYISSIAFSTTSKKLVSGSFDKTVRIWNLDEGQAPKGVVLRGHTDRVRCVAFSPDGSRIASGSDDCTIFIWSTETRGRMRVLDGHSGGVLSVAFAPNGEHIVSGSADETVMIWNAETGMRTVDPLRGHLDVVNTVAVSPSLPYRIASGSNDGNVRLWDLDTGEAFGKPLWGHEGPIHSIAFSPDGKRAVSGSGDHTLRTWEIGAPTGSTSHVYHSV